MPPRNSFFSRLRHGRAWDEWDEGSDSEDDEAAATPARQVEPPKPQSRRRRLAVTFVFATLFVAGAAFSAGAGNQVRTMLEGQAAQNAVGADEQAATEETTAAAAPADPASPADPSDDDAAPPQAPSDDASPDAPAAPATPATPGAPSAPAAAPAVAAAPAAAVSAAARAVQRVSTSSPTVTRATGKRAHGRVARHRAYARTMRAASHKHAFPKRAKRELVKAAPPDLDGAAPGAATVWLNRALPDPTPPALRLRPQFAKRLLAVSRNGHVSWALMLGVLRSEGHNGASPADLAGLRGLASRLGAMGARAGTPWAAMFSLSSSTTFADRAVALSHYYRAVGLTALVRGLVDQKEELEQKVLNDPRVAIYAGGRGDVEAHRVNVRVLAVVEYLADSFGQVTVSCLISGHRLYARPGVISAHIYGLAADISELGGVAILGHQQQVSVTERGVRDLLLLPPELMPRQVISRLGLGGPSFPLANHYNHIHIGY
jgi:hypothetical protein